MYTTRGSNQFQTIATKTSGAQTLPVTTLTVDSTTNFAPRGVIWVGDQQVTYTAIGSATTFTGCTGGTGARPDDTFVSQSVHRLFWPRGYVPGTKKGVLIFSGGGGTADQYIKSTATQREQTIALTNAGFPVATCNSDWHWGNSINRTRATNLRTWVQGIGFFAAGKVHVVGVSMGGAIAFNWAKYNPTLVQSVTGQIPALDMQWIHANDPLGQGYPAMIEWNYASGSPGTQPTNADNPADNAATFDSNNIPVRIYASTNDPVCNYTSGAQAFDSGAGTTCELISLGAVGHSLSGMDYDAMAAFLTAND